MEKFGQYKGIFYNNKTTHRYYEAGAHFSYSALVRALKELKKESNNTISSESSSSSKRKEQKKLNEIKKVDMLPLSRQKNKSTGCLIDTSKKIKADEIYNKIMNDQLDISKNNRMKILQKVKNVENDKFSKKRDSSNRHFNSSIYYVKNKINMPLIYNQNQKNNNNIIKDNEINNNDFKIIKHLNSLNIRHQNMNSTIGFNEPNKYLKSYLINNLDNSQNNPSFCKNNINSSGANSKSIRRHNNIISINKFELMNKFKNKSNSISHNKNTNSIDYNIKINNIVKINDKYFNNTKLNFNTDKSVKRKFLSKESKNNDKKNMNISIFNFSKLKYPKKFFINKNMK